MILRHFIHFILHTIINLQNKRSMIPYKLMVLTRYFIYSSGLFK